MQALDEVYQAEERRMDARFGMLASVLANCHRGKGRRPFKPEDFMPKERPRTPEELESRINRFARAMNARVIHPDNS